MKIYFYCFVFVFFLVFSCVHEETVDQSETHIDSVSEARHNVDIVSFTDFSQLAANLDCQLEVFIIEKVLLAPLLEKEKLLLLMTWINLIFSVHY